MPRERADAGLSPLRLVSDLQKEAEVASTAKTKKTNTPGVYRRGDRYLYTYRLEGRQRWGTADPLDEARRSKRHAEADADRGELRDLSRVRFGEFALDWIITYQGRTSAGFRESTRRSYRQMLTDRVIPYFDGERRLHLAEIQPRDVKTFVRWLIEQEDPRRPGRLLSKSTIRQHVAVLRALLGDAMEEGAIRTNPAAGVRVSVPEGDGTGREPATSGARCPSASCRGC
ncbi:MAG: phage integrase SAM-like domain-containing protein [Thermoleophilaceae bacterium]